MHSVLPSPKFRRPSNVPLSPPTTPDRRMWGMYECSSQGIRPAELWLSSYWLISRPGPLGVRTLTCKPKANRTDQTNPKSYSRPNPLLLATGPTTRPTQLHNVRRTTHLLYQHHPGPEGPPFRPQFLGSKRLHCIRH